MTEPVRFAIPGRLPDLNQYTAANRAHRQAGAALKRSTELGIMWCARRAQLQPIPGPVFISFAWHECDRRRDADNVAFARKFILDALVRLGVLTGDGRKHVVGFADEFHVDPINPRVVVSIEQTSA